MRGRHSRRRRSIAPQPPQFAPLGFVASLTAAIAAKPSPKRAHERLRWYTGALAIATMLLIGCTTALLPGALSETLGAASLEPAPSSSRVSKAISHRLAHYPNEPIAVLWRKSTLEPSSLASASIAAAAAVRKCESYGPKTTVAELARFVLALAEREPKVWGLTRADVDAVTILDSFNEPLPPTLTLAGVAARAVVRGSAPADAVELHYAVKTYVALKGGGDIVSPPAPLLVRNQTAEHPSLAVSIAVLTTLDVLPTLAATAKRTWASPEHLARFRGAVDVRFFIAHDDNAADAVNGERTNPARIPVVHLQDVSREELPFGALQYLALLQEPSSSSSSSNEAEEQAPAGGSGRRHRPSDPRAPFVLLVQDQVLVNIEALLQFVQHLVPGVQSRAMYVGRRGNATAAGGAAAREGKVKPVKLCSPETGLLFTRALIERMMSHLDECASDVAKALARVQTRKEEKKKEAAKKREEEEKVSMEDVLMRAPLTAFFKRHNPAKLHRVNGLVQKYKYDMEKLYMKLEQKYGARPAPVQNSHGNFLLRKQSPQFSASSAVTTAKKEKEEDEFRREKEEEAQAALDYSHALGRCIANHLGVGCGAKFTPMISTAAYTRYRAARLRSGAQILYHHFRSTGVAPVSDALNAAIVHAPRAEAKARGLTSWMVSLHAQIVGQLRPLQRVVDPIGSRGEAARSCVHSPTMQRRFSSQCVGADGDCTLSFPSCRTEAVALHREARRGGFEALLKPLIATVVVGPLVEVGTKKTKHEEEEEEEEGRGANTNGGGEKEKKSKTDRTWALAELVLAIEGEGIVTSSADKAAKEADQGTTFQQRCVEEERSKCAVCHSAFRPHLSYTRYALSSLPLPFPLSLRSYTHRVHRAFRRANMRAESKQILDAAAASSSSSSSESPQIASPPPSLLLLRDDCQLNSNFTHALVQVLGSRRCGAHLWTAQRGGVLVIGWSESTVVGNHREGGISLLDVEASERRAKCDQTALVAARVPSDDDEDDLAAAAAAAAEEEEVCRTEAHLDTGTGTDAAPSEILGAIFHPATFASAMSFLDAFGASSASKKSSENPRNALEALVVALQIEGHIVRSAHRSLLTML